ncbi:hypothetical protein MCHI_003478, partial [Candidatus Magnetoovum chiemensis]
MDDISNISKENNQANETEETKPLDTDNAAQDSQAQTGDNEAYLKEIEELRKANEMLEGKVSAFNDKYL